MDELPRLNNAADVDALDAAIAAGRLPIRSADLFWAGHRDLSSRHQRDQCSDAG